ncbi:glycosyl transferase [Parapedobacter defluvii]|uniref:Glycosyl transferase n=1 Tax=Parapedobacter defluvii TaxID=2045106 RepID=A0ABQ1LVX9_9SPHI|nr:glycosyltransferase [Parapedobacter defluvii]GGC30026.1 glycosyl transferase [Parapedobacter defluvii]
MNTLSFVFVSLQRIHTDRDSTSTNLAKELAKRHKVLYINAPIDMRTYYSGKSDSYIKEHIRLIRSQSKDNYLRQTSANMWVLNPQTIIDSINWIPHTGIFSLLNRRNNKRLAKEFKKVLKSIGFKQFILINDKDIYRSFYLKELLNPLLYVYLDRDYIVGMKYWKRHGAKLEPKLIEKSDLVLCNSPGFTDRAKPFNSNSYYIGNGCNVELFDINKYPECPEDLKRLKDRPIVGYVGALLAMRLDIDLIVYLAVSRPMWNFVLVGSEDDAFANSQLHKLTNVYFLGKKDTKQVPAYIKYFDVCINPQAINEITNENYPLKIDEYLAMGRPTVATQTHVMKQVFSPVVKLASNQEDFLNEIEASLNENDSDRVQERVELARSHSWEKITENVLRVILKHLNNGKNPIGSSAFS